MRALGPPQRRAPPRHGGALSLVVALVTACAGQWHSRAAEKPLTPAELSSWNLTIADDAHDAALRAAFARALADDGFRVVDHPPYHEDLEVTLSMARDRAGAVALATLRSDGFFIEEVQARLDGAGTAKTLARRLAVAQGTADFFRNSGTPQQKGLSGQ